MVRVAFEVVVKIALVRRLDAEHESAPTVDDLLGKVHNLRHVRDVASVEFHNAAEIFVRLKLIGADVKKVNRCEDFLNHCQIGKGSVGERLQPLAKETAATFFQENLRNRGPSELSADFFD